MWVAVGHHASLRSGHTLNKDTLVSVQWDSWDASDRLSWLWTTDTTITLQPGQDSGWSFQSDCASSSEREKGWNLQQRMTEHFRNNFVLLLGDLITCQFANICLDKHILIEQIISSWVRNTQTYLCYYLYNLFEGADGFNEVGKLQVTEVMKGRL